MIGVGGAILEEHGPGSRIPLTGVTPEELMAQVPGVRLTEARRVVSAVHAGRDLALVDGSVRRSTRELLAARGCVPRLTIVDQALSDYDAFMKLVLRTSDD